MLRRLICVAAICGFAALVGCGQTQPIAERISPNKRLTIVDGPLNVAGNDVYIIRDKESGQEFLLADGVESVALCPIQSKGVAK